MTPPMRAPQAPHAPTTTPIDSEAVTRLWTVFLSGRSPHTVDAYTRDFDDFCAFLGRYRAPGAPAVFSHTAARFEALTWLLQHTPGRANELALLYQHDLTARHKSTATAARRVSTIKSVLKYARMLGFITWALDIPAQRIERCRDTRGPSLDTIQAMLAIAAAQPAPTGPRDVALVRLAYDLALRISELARLDVADVELQTGGLWIFGKGRRAKELLTMPDTARAAVQEWLTVRGRTPGPLLLSLSHTNHRGRLTTRGVYRLIRDLGAAAGAHVWPHGIRHTAITQAIDAAAAHGLSIDLVRQFSRHRGINTLLIYRDQHENKQSTLATWVAQRLPISTPANGRLA